MRELLVPVVEDGKEVLRVEQVYTADEIPWTELLFFTGESKKKGVHYIEIPAAFDIETSNITGDGRPYGVMYHWQFCLDKYVVFGRTWDEFQQFLKTLSDKLNLSVDKSRLVVWVHNLPFEFQFMRRFVNISEGFFREPYKPLRMVTGEGIEWRCSYALSNMSLGQFCRNSPGCIHWKLSGDDYDYSKLRTPSTYMTDKELGYCYNDVRGLCECIAHRMQDDTLATMPMTSTGYVRRDMRNATRRDKKQARNYRRMFQDLRLTPEQYQMMRRAFRGGNTHANALHAGKMIGSPMDPCHSYDIASSYPAVMMTEYFPMAAFETITWETQQQDDPRMEKYCYCFDIILRDISYCGRSGVPYISIDKAEMIDWGPEHGKEKGHRNPKGADNGRIRKAHGVSLTLTEIDWRIIQQEYHIEEYRIGNMNRCRKGPLPAELKGVIMEYYRNKTMLKGSGNDYLYNKLKALLNATFGCMVQRIDMDRVIFDGNTFEFAGMPLEELLEQYYKSRNSFLSYQWGVWVTAHARARLEYMLEIVGPDVLYCDTDSIKYRGDHTAEFEKRNKELQELAEKHGAYAPDRKGKRRYLGVWEREDDMIRFKTLGAKKYIYDTWEYKNGEWEVVTHATIAGVNKKKGSSYFQKMGYCHFQSGETIDESGHIVAYRNDDDIHEVTIQGERIKTGSNLALIDDTYTIDKTGSYLDLLEKIADNMEYYNMEVL